MKRLILKVLLLSLFIIAFAAILNFFYKKTNYFKEGNRNDLAKYSNMPDNIQLANLGSSHGYTSLDYTGLPYRTFDFSLAAQRYLYDYALLSQYIEKFDKNAVVLILVEYMEVTQIPTDFSNVSSRYYRILDKNHLPDYSFKDYLRYQAVPILSEGSVINIVRAIIDSPHIPIPITPFSELTEIERINHCKGMRDMCVTGDLTAKRTRYAGEEGFAYNKSLLSKMIELCLAHDIQPVLITTPLVSVLNRIFAEESPDFLDTFYRLSRELQETYPTVPYFDYSRDPRFENDFALFGDSHHLNAAGAKKFTAIVVSDLQTSGLLAGE